MAPHTHSSTAHPSPPHHHYRYSLSDDPTKLGAPKDFVVTVRDLYVSAGAGFLVVSLGDITFIPGLPIKPAYYKIDVEFPDGEAPRVVGLS